MNSPVIDRSSDENEPDSRLEKLLAECAKRHEAALKELYGLAAPVLHGVLTRILKDEIIAEKALSDSFVRIWHSSANYSPEYGTPTQWMINQARRQALDMIRQDDDYQPAEENLDSSQLIFLPAEFAEQASADNGHSIATLRLLHLLNQLPEAGRDCIMEAYCEACSHEELSQRLDVPVSAVKSWLHRDLPILKSALDKADNHSREEEWWSLVAAEFVIGTLRGEDLTLFESIVDQDDAVAAEVLYWEKRLVPLNETTPPLHPPATVWPLIQAQILTPADDREEEQEENRDEPRVMSSTQTVMPPAENSAGHSELAGNGKAPRDIERRAVVLDADRSASVEVVKQDSSARIWKVFSALAIAVAVMLAAMHQRQPPLSPRVALTAAEQFQSDGVSVVIGDRSSPLWLVETDFDSRQVRVTGIDPPPISAIQDFELWQVLPSGIGVESIGILPRSAGDTSIHSAQDLPTLFEAFVVTLEDKGGSPKAVPSGTAYYKGEFVYTKKPVIMSTRPKADSFLDGEWW